MPARLNIIRALQNLFRKTPRERDLSAEVRAHLDLLTDEKIRAGLAPDEARRTSLIEFGGAEQVKEEVRSVRAGAWLDSLLGDLRFAARTLSKASGVTAVAIATIALGVGLNVGIFTVLNGLMLKPIPVPHPDQMISFSQIFRGNVSREVHGENSMFSYPEYLRYRDQNHVFTGLVAFEPLTKATLIHNGVRDIFGTVTSCNYFDVLNEHPQLGRAFIESDCAGSGVSPVVVISNDLWRGAFAGDPAIVGKQINLSRVRYTVVGVAPPGFSGTEPINLSFWAPVMMHAAIEPGRDYSTTENLSWLALLGRLRPGVNMEQVRSDLAVIAGRIDQQYPNRTTSLRIEPATFMSRPEEREVFLPIAAVTLVAFGLVLLIACANVANLLLARSSERQKEMALRLSIGATPRRLIQQLLTESLLLSLTGGVLGSLLAFWSFAGITHFAISHLPPGFPPVALNVAPDARVLAYALVLTLLTGIAFGLIPALQSNRPDLNTALKNDSASLAGSGKSNRFLRDALVAAQAAVCMILLLAAGLLLRGLHRAQTADPGFETKNITSAFLNLRLQGYTQDQSVVLMQHFREQVAALPGVTATAQAECAPLSNDHSEGGFTTPGHDEKIQVEYNHVTPEYFSLLNISIVLGRNFTPAERPENSPSIIVSQSTARRFWPGGSPLSKVLRDSTNHEYQVIGVAKDAQTSELGKSDNMYLYFPSGPQNSSSAYLLVRHSGSSLDVEKGIRQALRSLDPDLPVDIVRLEDYLETARLPSRIATMLSGALGALALLLASIGVYAMASYSVSRRVREIGIRVALGASGAEVLNLVLRQAMRPVLIGSVFGLIGATAVSSVLASLLFGLGTHDPLAFTVIPIFLLGVALIASYIPARRAMRVDPMTALRYE
jgi:predicted permease